MKYSTVYILTSGGKVSQATNFTSITMVSLIILCVAFHTRLISQSRDHDEVSIKTEHEIPIYDRKLNGRHHKAMGGQKKH